MKNKILVVILILIILGLSGFIIYDKTYNVKPKEKPKEKTTEEEIGSLSKEELYDIQRFLSKDTAKAFLKVYFKDTSQIDMNKVLLNNQLYSNDPAKEEKKYYCEIMKLETCNDEVPFEGNIKLYKKELVENYFKEYTGKDISVLNENLIPKYYSEKDDAYFNTNNGFVETNVYVIRGTKNDKDMYYVEYLGTASVDDEEKAKPVLRKVILKKSGGASHGYYFITNKKLK